MSNIDKILVEYYKEFPDLSTDRPPIPFIENIGNEPGFYDMVNKLQDVKKFFQDLDISSWKILGVRFGEK